MFPSIEPLPADALARVPCPQFPQPQRSRPLITSHGLHQSRVCESLETMAGSLNQIRTESDLNLGLTQSSSPPLALLLSK